MTQFLKFIHKLPINFVSISIIISKRHHFKMNPVIIDWCEKSKCIAFPLKSSNYKGQAGKIGIIGGSREYTGAPYFSGISALKVGADLVHIFCSKDAAIPIKCYSPELMVQPILDLDNFEDMKPLLQRLDIIVIGPGLGRNDKILLLAEKIINFAKSIKKSLIIDADCLFLIAQKLDLLDNCESNVILTPNKMEFARLLQLEHPNLITDKIIQDFFKQRAWGGNIVILSKGALDEIYCQGVKYTLPDFGGSFRRCGGQGDILAGSMGTFLHWAQIKKYDIPVACLSACKLVRKCNAYSFKSVGRSMLSTDMIEDIHTIFDKEFELA